jgi:hypothetical protein
VKIIILLRQPSAIFDGWEKVAGRYRPTRVSVTSGSRVYLSGQVEGAKAARTSQSCWLFANLCPQVVAHRPRSGSEKEGLSVPTGLPNPDRSRSATSEDHHPHSAQFALLGLIPRGTIISELLRYNIIGLYRRVFNCNYTNGHSIPPPGSSFGIVIIVLVFG